jgi:TPR repeat protein
VKQDYAEAAKWYRKAAEQGDICSQYELGMMYEDGHGVPQDFVQAYMWFDLEAAQGLPNGQDKRDSIAKKMTPAQIAEAQRLTREWKPSKGEVQLPSPSTQSVEKGVDSTRLNENKAPIRQEKPRAKITAEQVVRELRSKAPRFDDGKAAYKRGDYAKAYAEFKPLAEQGNADAQCFLGMMYYNGYGVQKDYAQAAKWYRKAAEHRGWLGVMIQDITPALAEAFGTAVTKGVLVADVVAGSPDEQGGLKRGDIVQTLNGKPVENANQLSRTVAAMKPESKATIEVIRDGKPESVNLTIGESGLAAAQCNLGVMYHNGQGVPKDYAQAAKWYRKAAEQGNALAQYNLGVMYYNGYGVPKDHSEALEWYQKAAEQGFAKAQTALEFAQNESAAQADAEAWRHVRAHSDAYELEQGLNSLTKGGPLTKCNYDRKSDLLSCKTQCPLSLAELMDSGVIDDMDDLNHAFISGCGKSTLQENYSVSFCTSDGITVGYYLCDIKTHRVSHEKVVQGGSCR